MTVPWPELELSEPTPLTIAGSDRVSAASGLAAVGDAFVVVLDDATHVGVFASGDGGRGRAVTLLADLLPSAQPARKRVKPDFEAVVELPGEPTFDEPSLLVIGSGSTERRMRAVRVPFELVHGDRPSDCCEVHRLDDLYAPMRRAAGDLNVEAVRVTATHMVLISRANGDHPVNLAASFELRDIRRWIDGESVAEPVMSWIDLGRLHGVPLGITDATPHPSGGWLASAAAEDTANSYADGRTVGSALVWFGDDDRMRRAWRLVPAVKVEGISARATGGQIEVVLVTDADDPAVSAAMYTVRLPGE